MPGQHTKGCPSNKSVSCDRSLPRHINPCIRTHHKEQQQGTSEGNSQNGVRCEISSGDIASKHYDIPQVHNPSGGCSNRTGILSDHHLISEHQNSINNSTSHTLGKSYSNNYHNNGESINRRKSMDNKMSAPQLTMCQLPPCSNPSFDTFVASRAHQAVDCPGMEGSNKQMSVVDILKDIKTSEASTSGLPVPGHAGSRQQQCFDDLRRPPQGGKPVMCPKVINLSL